MREIFAIAAALIIIVSMSLVVKGSLDCKKCKHSVENLREIQ